MIRWIVTRVDGKVSSVSANFGHFAQIAKKVASGSVSNVSEVTVSKVSTEEVLELSRTLKWEDLLLFGSPFQIRVWKELYNLTHRDGEYVPPEKLLSYSELAELCGNPKGVRAVAHAVAGNPVAVIIPCHLIIPKESIDKAKEIRSRAQKTIFKGEDLYLLNSIDVGEYAYGSKLKRELISREMHSR